MEADNTVLRRELDRRAHLKSVTGLKTRQPSSIWGVMEEMLSQDGEGGGREKKKHEGGMVGVFIRASKKASNGPGVSI